VVRRFRRAGDLGEPGASATGATINDLAAALAPEHGRWLARNPAPEEVARLCQEVARRLADAGRVADPTDALALKETPARRWFRQAGEFLGAEPRTFAGEVLKAVQERRTRLWR
jgi:hypothetical protein